MTINAQLSYDTFGDDEESRGATYDQTIKIRPVIGIWEDNFVNPETAKIGRWLARTNDTYTAMPNNKIGNTFNFQTYTLITAVKLVKDVKYSFRVVTGFASKKHELTVKAFSEGNTGSEPVSYYSAKRLN